MSLAYRFKMPLAQANRLISKLKAKTDHLAIVKPERTLGAIWVDDHVQQRKPVVMCEMCWRKYSPWWKVNHYRPDWGWRYRSDCHGCSSKFVICSLFVAEEKFFTVLDQSNHGIYAQP